jgi:hypothetical protein
MQVERFGNYKWVRQTPLKGFYHQNFTATKYLSTRSLIIFTLPALTDYNAGSVFIILERLKYFAHGIMDR